MALHDHEVVRLADKVIGFLGKTPEDARRALGQGNYTPALLEKAAVALDITFRDRARYLYVLGAVRDRVVKALYRRTHAKTKPAPMGKNPSLRKTRIEYTLTPEDD